MATLEYKLDFKIKDGSFTKQAPDVGRKSVALTNGYYDDGSQLIGTTEETITIAVDQGNIRDLVIVNRDDTNFVELGYATGVYVMKLFPGEAYKLGCVAASSDTLYLKADTASCRVDWMVSSN